MRVNPITRTRRDYLKRALVSAWGLDRSVVLYGLLPVLLGLFAIWGDGHWFAALMGALVATGFGQVAFFIRWVRDTATDLQDSDERIESARVDDQKGA